MNIKAIPLIFLLLTFFKISFSRPEQQIDSLMHQVEEKINADLLTDNLHGSISVAIAKNDTLIWSGAYGYVANNSNVKPYVNTIYRIGSITKTFTATLLMKLVQQGKLQPDDPVENFLPEVKTLKGYYGAGKITFRQLATHTSGLNREPDASGFDAGPIDRWQQKVFAAIPKTSLRSKPGSGFYYSNIGYAILGVALSRVAGLPYTQMVQQYILNPLQMKDTYFILPADKLPYLAKGIGNSDGKINTQLPEKELSGRGYKVPNGGIFSTPNDLAKFAAMLIGYPSIIDTNQRQIMQTPPSGSNYAFGLITFKSANFNTIGHDGSAAGYTSMMTVDKNSGYSVIIMRNYNEGKTNFGEFTFDLLSKLNALH